jgi:hypothetical protein
MVEVHVRDEDGVDRGDVLDQEPRFHEPLADLPHRAREHGVGEDDLVVDLNQRRRVPHPEHREARIGSNRVLDLVFYLGDREEGEDAAEHAAARRDEGEAERRATGETEPSAHQKYRNRNVAIHGTGEGEGE